MHIIAAHARFPIDSHKKTSGKRDSMHVELPYKTLLDHVKTDSTVSLNVLDMPLGRKTVAFPPRFQAFASDEYCANSAQTLFGEVQDLRDSTSWGTVATRNAVSWFHLDDEGFCTSVLPQTGGKYWVLARLKEHLRQGVDEMSNTGVFEKFQVDSIDPEVWDLEAVHLDSSCGLYVPAVFYFWMC